MRRWLVRVLGHPAVTNLVGQVRSAALFVDMQPIARGELTSAPLSATATALGAVVGTLSQATATASATARPVVTAATFTAS